MPVCLVDAPGRPTVAHKPATGYCSGVALSMWREAGEVFDRMFDEMLLGNNVSWPLLSPPCGLRLGNDASWRATRTEGLAAVEGNGPCGRMVSGSAIYKVNTLVNI